MGASVLKSIICNGVPKIKSVVQNYFDNNMNINNVNTAISLEKYSEILTQLLTFEYDQRICAKDILIHNKENAIFKSLIEEWDIGKDVYEIYTTNSENLKNIKNI